MRILVDADACPVKKQIIRVAKRHQIPVMMLIDTSHQLEDGYSQVIVVDKARDSVDIKLINLLRKEDLVVTQDYGVAAMALGKGAKAIHQSGMVYDQNNIDRLLFERHLGAKIRRAGGKTANPKKRAPADDLAFEAALERLVQEGLEKESGCTQSL